jgi:hypothetical protein
MWSFIFASQGLRSAITYDVGNPGPGLGQAPKCSEVKLVNGIPLRLFGYLDLQQKYIYNQTIKTCSDLIKISMKFQTKLKYESNLKHSSSRSII